MKAVKKRYGRSEYTKINNKGKKKIRERDRMQGKFSFFKDFSP